MNQISEENENNISISSMKLYIRKIYRGHFWKKTWYKRIFLFWVRSFMGKSVLTPFGWVKNPSIAFKEGLLWNKNND